MERVVLKPRADWRKKVEAVGMSYHTIDGETYWDESACYLFQADEIDRLEEATAELHALCLQAVEQVIEKDLFSLLRIPVVLAELAVHSWRSDEASLLGRFDLAYDGLNPPKLLEYNADTPTSLLEASVVQWFWLQEVFPQADQFNSIHEKLIETWRDNFPSGSHPIHFSCVADAPEDQGNLEYLMDTAVQAKLPVRFIGIENIGFDGTAQCFCDLDNEPIGTLFKLYPWEWLAQEEFGRYLQRSGLRLIEPAWKIILSNKGILPLLWEFFPGHPLLLEAHFDETKMEGVYVSKPFFSREGENVQIHRAGNSLSIPGSYGGNGCIYQRYAPLPNFAGNFPVIGSWVIGGAPAGIGIREDSLEITTNESRFIPHLFQE